MIIIIEYYIIRVHHTFYENTLLEGVKIDGKFIILDCKKLCGNSLNGTFMERYEQLKEKTNNIINDVHLNDLELYLTNIYSLKEMEILLEKINNTKLIIDSILFKDNNNKENYYLSITENQNIKKLKITKTEMVDVYNVFDNENPLGVACIPNIKNSFTFSRFI